ncbi:hypothetical protein [Roseovarius lutimaris]|uniref:hypothetical protein n=1 Tax=Roseovarius lutimaris TaxID=1005928 RepID=UPI001FE21AA2|nr:hypothetical protein [Roseovarius lutimaris]
MTSSPHQSLPEPNAQIFKIQAVICDTYDKIVNRLIVVDCQRISASLDEDFDRQPSRSLIAINKPMISNHALQQGRRFSVDWPVISRIGSAQSGFDQTKVTHTSTTAIGQCLIMCGNRVCQRYPVMLPTDRPNASTLICVFPKPPSQSPSF